MLNQQSLVSQMLFERNADNVDELRKHALTILAGASQSLYGARSRANSDKDVLAAAGLVLEVKEILKEGGNAGVSGEVLTDKVKVEIEVPDIKYGVSKDRSGTVKVLKFDSAEGKAVSFDLDRQGKLSVREARF